ncbi:hypothetical protein BwDG23_72470 [Bradyrhizobium ottawaense]|nr:hypothetical protein BwSF21_70750 [Bradyrhizobium ottawaense]GMO85942.1 hypothetical protein BwSH17_68310 [Bradyrhizobium ottawaense]GMO88704.1 hypothetical protein BwSG10_72470 [Bradyrhizobium ottawaense]GMO91331.1 hypothetical protein BwSF19_68920 [Bradyrhizobium ottawaense]GMP12801.1 hypothetical protein BwDG23_72470 [Bradyrhizobium ottawaense]
MHSLSAPILCDMSRVPYCQDYEDLFVLGMDAGCGLCGELAGDLVTRRVDETLIMSLSAAADA